MLKKYGKSVVKQYNKSLLLKYKYRQKTFIKVLKTQNKNLLEYFLMIGGIV